MLGEEGYSSDDKQALEDARRERAQQREKERLQRQLRDPDAVKQQIGNLAKLVDEPAKPNGHAKPEGKKALDSQTGLIERALLGALLADPTLRADKLTPDDFLEEQARATFKAIMQLNHDGISADRVMIRARFPIDHQYLDSLLVGTHPENLAAYAGELKAAKRERDFRRILSLLESSQTAEDRRRYSESLQQIIEGQGSEQEWRSGFRSFGQLSSVPPKFVVSGLIPESALTQLVAPSYHGKTWFALQLGHAISIGLPLFCFDVRERIPVAYHVPEMNEALIRERMAVLGVEDSEDFLVRPMECGLWPLRDPRMIESSKGRVVFLDTQGFFNDADDPNNYQQALDFGQDVFALLNAGCRAVVALSHPPKSSTQHRQKEPYWTLENSVLGSAAYGGILRSCLRIRNLNLDLNDPNLHVYCQGLKNPGLKPFQLEGAPLRMKVAPGDSPYLHELLEGMQDRPTDPRKLKAFELFARSVSDRRACQELKVGNKTVAKWRKEWAGRDDDEDDEPEQVM